MLTVYFKPNLYQGLTGQPASGINEIFTISQGIESTINLQQTISNNVHNCSTYEPMEFKFHHPNAIIVAIQAAYNNIENLVSCK